MTEQKDKSQRSLHEDGFTVKISRRYKPIPGDVCYMSDADRVFLKNILDKDRQERYPELAEDEHFEVFTAEHILKSYALGADDIQSGLVGASNDGGVDSIYFLMDRKLVTEDPTLAQYTNRRDIPFELIIIQSTRSPGFSEDRINRLQAMTNDLLDLGKETTTLAKTYNAPLLERVNRFRNTYRELITRHPELAIAFHFVSQADAVDPKAKRKAEILEKRLRELFSDAKVTFRFVTARDMLALYNTNPPTSISLRFQKVISSSQFGTAYVCLVPLKELYSFITDAGDLRQDIFEDNVRDYQGEIRVNKDIQETLVSDKSSEFWWLNNGITVIGSHLSSSGDNLTVDDPSVVNGLQTSTEIFKYFKTMNQPEDSRSVLVRFIQTTDPAERDRVIRATNNQTSIAPSALYAGDDIQRNIETYLPKVGLYYDRRKKYYRNRGVPVAKIVTISEMSQALMAIVLRQPDEARARPNTVTQKRYSDLFNADYPPALYANCALLMKRVDQYIKARGGTDLGSQSNIRYYVAMYLSCIAVNSSEPTRAQIANLSIDAIDKSLFANSYGKVWEAYSAEGEDDLAAKGPNLVKRLANDLLSTLGHPGSS